MGWINGFELMCYLLSAALITDIVRKHDLFEGKLFASGAIAGYTLELLAVRVTDIYYYSPRFWLSFGFEPYQFPVFGGLMWGGLTVCALRIAQRLGFSRTMTVLATGFLIVSMDLLLDVAAIRLDGGFWTWAGRPITLDITHHMFMSVIWVNFLGYLFETPMVVWLALRDDEKRKPRPMRLHVLACIANALGGIAFVAAASAASLGLNAITDEWFACIAFIALWTFILVRIIVQLVRQTILQPQKTYNGRVCREWFAVVFFAAMYAYCFAGLGNLGVFDVHPLFAVVGVLLFALTVVIGTAPYQSHYP